MHLQTSKRALRYLKGIVNYGIFYKPSTTSKFSNFMGYTDSDNARDDDDNKSTCGYVFMFSSGDVSWSLKKQPIVTFSSTESEYVTSVSIKQFG